MATETQVTDRAGKTMNVTKIGDRLYPGFDHESLLHGFDVKARPDDIVLCTFPKSGTHWTFEVVRLLLAGTTDLPTVEKDDFMIEFASPSTIVDCPSPRNINIHYHFELMSPDFLRQKSKIIYVTRDPRDISVSFFNHVMKFKDFFEYDGEWKDFIHLFLQGQVVYDSWFEYTKGWEKGMKEHPDHPFLVMSFEDMKEDPLREVRRLADFINTKHSEEFLKEVVDKTSFKKMVETRKATGNGLVGMYRKGQVGDWKNWFTVAQSEMFNDVFEKEMVGTDAYKLYSHTFWDTADANMNAV